MPALQEACPFAPLSKARLILVTVWQQLMPIWQLWTGATRLLTKLPELHASTFRLSTTRRIYRNKLAQRFSSFTLSLEHPSPLVKAYSTQIVDHIDSNFSSFERQLSFTARCTTFAYDLSVAEARYYNNCIRASTTAGDINAPGAIIPVSFDYLRTELTWGRYTDPPSPLPFNA